MGKQLKDLNDFDSNAQKGDWCFINDDSMIAIQYGDDRFLEIVLLPINSKEQNKISWNWNGNKESPTLEPSILVWGNGKNNPTTWHGYFRNGELEIC